MAGGLRVRRSVLIVINSLHSGGAEKTCIELARDLRDRCDLHVVSLVIGGPAEQQLRALGVEVTVMPADGAWQRFRSCLSLARMIRTRQPDVVITFLYIADMVGGTLARLLVPGVRVFWNIRNNVLRRDQVGSASYAICRLNGILSRFIPSAITYCSAVSRAQHELIGYRSRDSFVVENSPASVPFSFSAPKRADFRRARFEDDFLFLFVARFDPVKRVDLYLQACIESYRRFGGNVRFVLAGRGMDTDNAWLKGAIDGSGIAERFVMLGFVSDQQQLYSAADCLIVTSESEGSPNAVFEAMATKLPAIIFATLGTEGLEGPGVHRIETRSIDRLVEAMGAILAQGIPAPALRFGAGDAAAVAEHPLVTFYRTALDSR